MTSSCLGRQYCIGYGNCGGPLYHIIIYLSDAITAAGHCVRLDGHRAVLNWLRGGNAPLDSTALLQTAAFCFNRLNDRLDAGRGKCLLRNPFFADTVRRCLLGGDGHCYLLDEWCIMPNHVHALVRMLPGGSPVAVQQEWKDESNAVISLALGRPRQIWHGGYFDQPVRTGAEYLAQKKHIRLNPLKAGLENWPWHGGGQFFDGEASPC